MSEGGPATAVTSPDFVLSDQQRAFFDSFGFLRLRGLFRDDIATLTEGFEEVFATHETWDTNVSLHFDERRSIVPAFITKSDKLSWLLQDDRVNGIVSSLMGSAYEYAESDGNLFYCDTSWHSDIYGSPFHQFHLKLSFYLDPLTGADDGAIRMIPGSNWHVTPYAEGLRRDLETPELVEANFGVHPSEIPGWTLESSPGDVIVWNFRTIHASFNGNQRRRLFSVNFRQLDGFPGDAGLASV
jgi:hypothetical protein